MRVPRLYIAQPLKTNTLVHLDKDASRYLGSVLRMSKGQSVVLFNGQGGEFQGELVNLTKNQATVSVLQSKTEDRESPLKVHLVIGISRGERMDWVIQKATELGVNNISPLLSEYSVIKLESKKIKSKTLHWKKIIQSSCEQSKRNYIPTMNAPETIETFINKPSENNYRIILDPKASKSIGEISPNEKKIDLLIGPEGGFTDSEVEDAYEKGFIGVSLGYRTLRSETAAIAAIAIIQSQWGDMKADFAHKKR